MTKLLLLLCCVSCLAKESPERTPYDHFPTKEEQMKNPPTAEELGLPSRAIKNGQEWILDYILPIDSVTARKYALSLIAQGYRWGGDFIYKTKKDSLK